MKALDLQIMIHIYTYYYEPFLGEHECNQRKLMGLMGKCSKIARLLIDYGESTHVI